MQPNSFTLLWESRLVLTSDASTRANTIIHISPRKRSWCRHKHKRKQEHKDQNFSFLCLRLCLRLRCNKRKRNAAQAQQKLKDIYHTWLCLASENTGFRLLRTRTVGNVRMILLLRVFALNCVFTWVIPVACVCSCRLYLGLCLRR